LSQRNDEQNHLSLTKAHKLRNSGRQPPSLSAEKGFAMNTTASILASFFAVGLVGCAADSDGAAETSTHDLNAAAGEAPAAPTEPPGKVAGLDFSGGPDWAGIPLATVEQALGAGQQPGDDGETTYYNWGANGELTVGFNDATHMASFYQLNPG